MHSIPKPSFSTNYSRGSDEGCTFTKFEWISRSTGTHGLSTSVKSRVKKKNIKKAQKMNSNVLRFNEADLGIESYELMPLIKDRTENVEEIGYDDIPHSDVVNRALLNKKPFLEGEKGYRDTLIWLSLLDLSLYLSSSIFENKVRLSIQIWTPFWLLDTLNEHYQL